MRACLIEANDGENERVGRRIKLVEPVDLA
jgi:hypothetical protein